MRERLWGWREEGWWIIKGMEGKDRGVSTGVLIYAVVRDHGLFCRKYIQQYHVEMGSVITG